MSWLVEYSKSNRRTCQGSKTKFEKDELCFGKVTQMPSGDGEMKDMTKYFKAIPFFEMMSRMRKTTEKPTEPTDFCGFDELNEEDQERVTQWMKDFYDEDVDFPPKKEKAPKKRKGDAEDEDEGGASSAAPKAKKEKAAKKEPAEPEPQVGDGFGMVEGGWEDAEKRKELVAEITKTAIDRGVRLPVGSMSESMIKQVVGGVMMANRSDDHNDVDVGATLNALKERFGRDPPPLECACDANAKLATLFAELASWSFKTKDQRGGIAYRKVSKTLQEHDKPVNNGKEAKKLENIGQSSADKIDEFLASGKVAKLETMIANG